MKSSVRLIMNGVLSAALLLPVGVARAEEPILDGEQSLCVEIGAKTDYVVRRYAENFESSGHGERMLVGDTLYSCLDLNYLRDVHPDQLKEIREFIQRGRLNFAVRDRGRGRRLEVVHNTIVAFSVASQEEDKDLRFSFVAGFIASEVTNQAVRKALAQTELSPSLIDWIATLTGLGAGALAGKIKADYDAKHSLKQSPAQQINDKASKGASVPLFFKVWKFYGLGEGPRR